MSYLRREREKTYGIDLVVNERCEVATHSTELREEELVSFISGEGVHKL